MNCPKIEPIFFKEISINLRDNLLKTFKNRPSLQDNKDYN